MDRKEYMRQYREKNKKHSTLYMRTYMRANRFKHRAQRIVRDMINSGELNPTSCDFCGVVGQYGKGENERLFITHQDFLEPKNVKFICATCKMKKKWEEEAEHSTIDSNRVNHWWGGV